MWRLGQQPVPAVRSHSALVMDDGLHQSRRQPWAKCLMNDEHELGSQALRRLDECVFHAFTKGDFEPFLDLCDPNTVVRTVTTIPSPRYRLPGRPRMKCAPIIMKCAPILAASQLLLQLFSRSAADGETILMAAALHGRLDLVHLFLDIGAFPWTETLGRHSSPKNAIAFAMVTLCAEPMRSNFISSASIAHCPPPFFRCIPTRRHQDRRQPKLPHYCNRRCPFWTPKAAWSTAAGRARTRTTCL